MCVRVCVCVCVRVYRRTGISGFFYYFCFFFFFLLLLCAYDIHRGSNNFY